MEKTIELQGQIIKYNFQRSRRARHLRFAIQLNGSLVVTAPQHFPLLMVKHFLRQKSSWIIKRLAYFKDKPASFNALSDQEDYQKHQEATQDLVQQRLAYFNQFYHLEFNRISIRNQKTRWGSCSKRGNLNFNYRLIFLPPKIADYIIVHELCHLQELNHSSRFWNLVAKTIPNYKELRIALRKVNGNFQQLK